MPDIEGNTTPEDFSKFVGWTTEVDEAAELASEDPVDQTPDPSVTPAAPVTDPAPVAASPAPVVNPIEASRQEQIQNQNQQYQRQHIIYEINARAQGHKDQLISQGQEEAVAHQMAAQWAESTFTQYQSQQAVAYGQEQQRQNKARELSVSTGMSYDVLLEYPNEQSMSAAATQYKTWQTELNTVKQSAANATPKAPVQALDSHVSGAGATDASKKLDYAMGRITLPDAELNRLGIGT